MALTGHIGQVGPTMPERRIRGHHTSAQRPLLHYIRPPKSNRALAFLKKSPERGSHVLILDSGVSHKIWLL